MKNIMHFIIFQSVHFIIYHLGYHVKEINSDWFHGTCQSKEVCDVRILVEGRRVFLSCGQ